MLAPSVATWLALALAAAAAPDALLTTAERTGFERTGRYAEVERLCRAFERAFPGRARCTTFGTTPEGRPMLALAVSADGALDPAVARARRRETILFQGGIHAGEIDGKDAGFMALREWLAAGRAGPLARVTVVFVPVLNVDGNERFGPNQRPNQRGPAETARRRSARPRSRSTRRSSGASPRAGTCRSTSTRRSPTTRTPPRASGTASRARTSRTATGAGGTGSACCSRPTPGSRTASGSAARSTSSGRCSTSPRARRRAGARPPSPRSARRSPACRCRSRSTRGPSTPRSASAATPTRRSSRARSASRCSATTRPGPRSGRSRSSDRRWPPRSRPSRAAAGWSPCPTPPGWPSGSAPTACASSGSRPPGRARRSSASARPR